MVERHTDQSAIGRGRNLSVTQNAPLYTLRPAVNTATLDPGLSAESSIADATSVRVSVRLSPCWLSRSCTPRIEPPDDACSTCADEAPWKRDEVPIQGGVELFVLGGTRDDTADRWIMFRLVVTGLVERRTLFNCEPRRSTRGPEKRET